MISNRVLADELVRRGLVPDNCRLLEVVIGIDGAVVVRLEKYVTDGDLALFAEAFTSAAVRAIAGRKEG